MYFISDFNERLVSRLYYLMFPPEAVPKLGTKRRNSDADSGEESSKKRREDFDDPGNSSAIC